MIQAHIKHISVYTPVKTIENNELASYFGIDEKKIFRDSGVNTRYQCSENELASDLAVSAGHLFFQEHSEIKRSDIDFLLYCTSALDYVGPATACLIHEELNLNKNCGAMDIPMGCAGYTNGLIFAKSLIESGACKNILFITADMPTKVVHPDDYHLRILFSDAGAATLISTNGKLSIGNTSFGTDGSGAENLIIRGSGARKPVDQEWISKYRDVGGMLIGRMEMKGDEILRFTLREIPPLVNDVLVKHQISKTDIDFFIFHHASEIVLKFLKRKLDLEDHQLYSCLSRYGNTVSATIPIALQELMKEKDLTGKNHIFIAGFGIGYSWSGTILKIKTT